LRRISARVQEDDDDPVDWRRQRTIPSSQRLLAARRIFRTTQQSSGFPGAGDRWRSRELGSELSEETERERGKERASLQKGERGRGTPLGPYPRASRQTGGGRGDARARGTRELLWEGGRRQGSFCKNPLRFLRICTGKDSRREQEKKRILQKGPWPLGFF
jgi:hypothetical protein